MIMADLLGDGNVKVTFVLNIADISAPTEAELAAGVDLQTVITKDGLNISPEQASVDNTALASRDETEDAGTVRYSLELTVKRQEDDLDDVGWWCAATAPTRKTTRPATRSRCTRFAAGGRTCSRPS
jgi:hypothetical protein